MSNTATSTRLGRAIVAGCALVILSTSFAEAIIGSYGPRTIIGSNYQQTSDGQSTAVDGFNQGQCTNVSLCRVLFQKVPQKQKLIIQNVSCYVQIDSGSLFYGQLQTRHGQTIIQRNTTLTPVATTQGYWIVSSPVMHLVETGQNAFITFVSSTSAYWGTECSISGQLKTP